MCDLKRGIIVVVDLRSRGLGAQDREMTGNSSFKISRHNIYYIGRGSRATFDPLPWTQGKIFHVLHVKNGLKCLTTVLKILDLPSYTATFLLDFSQLIFPAGGPVPPQAPLKSPMTKMCTHTKPTCVINKNFKGVHTNDDIIWAW